MLKFFIVDFFYHFRRSDSAIAIARQRLHNRCFIVKIFELSVEKCAIEAVIYVLLYLSSSTFPPK